MDFRSVSEPSLPQEASDGLSTTERRRLRERTLAEAVERKIPEGGAVAGLDETLAAFNKGRLKRIVVRDGFAKMGRLCAWCHRPSLYESRCAGCGRRTEAILDVVDTLLRLARLQGCRVVRLRLEPVAGLRRIVGELNAESR